MTWLSKRRGDFHIKLAFILHYRLMCYILHNKTGLHDQTQSDLCKELEPELGVSEVPMFWNWT